MPLRQGTPDEVGMQPERVAHVRDLCARWKMDHLWNFDLFQSAVTAAVDD